VIRPRADVAVYLCVAAVDMRKQAASLALLVEQSLQGNIFEPAIYAFANRRADRVKLIYWERNGLVLWSKRLEKQCFIWPRGSAEQRVSLSGAELNALLDGFDIFQRGHQALAFRRIG
jgi:transposase